MTDSWKKIPHPSKKSCSVPGCPTPIAASIHKFPRRDLAKCNLWKEICGITKKTNYLFICSNHFYAEDFTLHNNRKTVNKDAFPLLNIPQLMEINQDYNPNNSCQDVLVPEKSECNIHKKSCILGCKTKTGEQVHYHDFPVNKVIRKKWIAACKLKNTQVKDNMFVCSAHFKKNDYLTELKSKNQALDPNAIPSQNLPEKPEDIKNFWKSEENITTFIYVPSNNIKLKDMKKYKNHSIVHIDVGEPSNEDVCKSHSNKINKESNNENVQPNQVIKNINENIQAKETIQNLNLMNNFSDTGNNVIQNQTNASVTLRKNHIKRNILHTNENNSPKRKCKINISNTIQLSTLCSACGQVFKLKEENSKNLETLAAQLLLELQDVNPSNEVEHLQFTKKGIEICDKILNKESIKLVNLLTNDNELTAFTGINFKLLDQIIDLIVASEKSSSQKYCLSMKEQIVMFLCKLRLNLSFGCLAMLFDTDEQSSIHIFFSLVKSLSRIMNKTIFWPKTEKLFKNIPECFQSFKQTRVILNCFQVLVEKQVCQTCQLELFSEKQQENSFKFLLGLAPSGLIVFKSNAFEGQESDSSIFIQSRILDCLDSTKEAIMIDNTLSVQSECAQHSFTLIKPPELGKKKIFSKNDVELIKNIAAARIHVDKTLQRFKKYKIMQTKISWRLLPYVNDICIIIAGLVNMNNPVLPKTVF